MPVLLQYNMQSLIKYKLVSSLRPRQQEHIFNVFMKMIILIQN